uniref:Uncharacterized protein n=1 Tax=Rhizophora mucronata TaxID=61149 RepID=A0A2P2IME8_RHIMU
MQFQFGVKKHKAWGSNTRSGRSYLMHKCHIEFLEKGVVLIQRTGQYTNNLLIHIFCSKVS